MLLGVISDIHANKPALDAVLADMPSVESLVCAGDVIGYNPWPSECVSELRSRSVPTIKGNHERMYLSGRQFSWNKLAEAGLKRARNTLTESQRDWIKKLPSENRIFNERVRVVHGHPQDPDRYTYPEEFTEDLLADERVLIMGHTHVQYHESFSTGVIVNPGSVGQPRDGDPRAAYAVVDLESLSVDQYRVQYDIEAVRDAIRDQGMPEESGRRLTVGR